MKAAQRMAIVGALRIAAAVARVDLLLGIEEEDNKRQVVVEFEQVQIEVVDARETNADELVGYVIQVFQTDNLPVKFSAGRSRQAADNHHERLAAIFRLGETLVETKEPAVLGSVPILPAAVGLGQGPGSGQKCGGEN
jgi:hypothetical protein